MPVAELIRQYFERSNALQWYWTLYVVIAGGLLAFSSLRQKPDLLTGILVTVLFCTFAYKNMSAIVEVTQQRHVLYQMIVADNPPEAVPASGPAAARRKLEQDFIQTLDDAPAEEKRNFHLISDVLIVLTLWAMELRRVRQARALTAAAP
jgi:hypothetical protein